jgi:hypothetical protein
VPPGAQALPSREDATEDREVQRDPSDAERRRHPHQRGHHRLDDAVLGIAIPPHQVQRQTLAAPGDEAQQADEPAVAFGGEHQ